MNRRAFLRGAAALPVAAVVPARPWATGGPVKPGAWSIGEDGPELFVPQGPLPLVGEVPSPGGWWRRKGDTGVFERADGSCGAFRMTQRIVVTEQPAEIGSVYVGDGCLIETDATAAAPLVSCPTAGSLMDRPSCRLSPNRGRGDARSARGEGVADDAGSPPHLTSPPSGGEEHEGGGREQDGGDLAVRAR